MSTSYTMAGSTIVWSPRETSRCEKTLIVVTIFSHAIDIAFGLFLTITGLSILNVKLISSISISLGALMIIASLSGVLGFMSNSCLRCGLKVDIILTPLIALYWFILVILSMTMLGNLKLYISRHAKQLETTKAYISNLNHTIIYYWIFMTLLGVTEIIRFNTIKKVNKYLSEDDTRQTGDQHNDLLSPLMSEERKGAKNDTTSIDSDDENTGFFSLQKQKCSGGKVEADEFFPIDSQLHVSTLHWSRGLNGSVAGDRTSVSSGETSISALYDIRWGNQNAASSQHENNKGPPKPVVDFL